MAGAEQLKVGVIMGSDSDMSTMRAAGIALREHGLKPTVDYEFRVISAHRTPKVMTQYAQEAEARGLQVIIAGAGGSAHLQGMTASETTIPVAGVAVTSNPTVMNRALGSCIGMPEGKPLATFQAKSGAYKAGIFAGRILKRPSDANRVAIITRNETEHAVMEHVGRALGTLGLQDEVDYEHILMPTFNKVYKSENWARDNGFGVLVASKSGRHSLTNVLASAIEAPVLGVAITPNPDAMSPTLDLLVNAPDYAPVAAFQGAAGAFNAGLKAARILAITNPDLRQKINAYNEGLKTTNIAKDRIMQRLGDVEYDELVKDELQNLIRAEMQTMITEGVSL